MTLQRLGSSTWFDFSCPICCSLLGFKNHPMHEYLLCTACKKNRPRQHWRMLRSLLWCAWHRCPPAGACPPQCSPPVSPLKLSPRKSPHHDPPSSITAALPRQNEIKTYHNLRLKRKKKKKPALIFCDG